MIFFGFLYRQRWRSKMSIYAADHVWVRLSMFELSSGLAQSLTCSHRDLSSSYLLTGPEAGGWGVSGPRESPRLGPFLPFSYPQLPRWNCKRSQKTTKTTITKKCKGVHISVFAMGLHGSLGPTACADTSPWPPPSGGALKSRLLFVRVLDTVSEQRHQNRKPQDYSHGIYLHVVLLPKKSDVILYIILCYYYSHKTISQLCVLFSPGFGQV